MFQPIIPDLIQNRNSSLSISALQASYPKDTLEEIKNRTHIKTLTIAGSDPSGGAGIQADLKTFSALNCYGMSVITALTAQNTQGVQSIQSLPAPFIESQMVSIFSDIEIDALKIGMLERSEIIETIARVLQENQITKPIIVDPVMFSKTGHKLLEDSAIDLLKHKILPFATILTPNTHEAANLLGMSHIDTEDEMSHAARALLEFGPQAVIVKGGFCSPGNDCLMIKGIADPIWLRSPLIKTTNLHGTGCSFSAAIASYLAHGDDVINAVKKAKLYLSGAIEAGSHYQLGKGIGPVHHFYSIWGVEGGRAYQSFVQESWLRIMPLFDRIKKHAFINRMMDDSLDREIFEFYLQQEQIFLEERAKAFFILASRAAPSSELAEYLTTRAQESMSASQTVFEKYGTTPPPAPPSSSSAVCGATSSSPSPACQKYTSFLIHIAEQGTLLEGLIAQLPCALMYQKLGEYIEGNEVIPNRHDIWIKTYSDPERKKRVETFIRHIEELAKTETQQEKRESMHKAFEQAAQYEFDFWDDAFNLRTA